MRVLLVEDEAELRNPLEARLRREGYTVDAADNGRDGLFLGREYGIDVGIVDIGLPQLSGIEVIRQLRQAGKHFPILILTARGNWQDKVEGLEAGADDYLVKPFHVEELLARLNALLRRAAGWSQPLIECGPIELNTRSQTVCLQQQPIDLTAYEYKVLEYMMLHAGQVVSKSELTEHIYDQDWDRDSNVIEVFVRRLRKKLDPEARYKPIETLRGRGYRFVLKRAESSSAE
ncbi:response regulator transcription factor [Candidatus Endoriftia persephone]|jgi:two-component system response regulator PhoP|uniref:Two-component system regulatory protein n=3 Tax=Gammaproteobacteria TaxID=1236 RepID=G2FIP5_9GAMM|nr:response regulator transcription factor [Candidatus Endoriftia persephone]EGV51452.1 virulence transcriptional regulatory protein phoP [endosymbiont of Riftia pachyptila (vent Ph05)]EGW53357.1 Two-component system regulatory protein [endosymbiont of Tevnia jerichonana (vent Tica)]USF86500.1 response regulator transcription factor [Candidatus Endoriftia persephone]